jgi:hypothetical protein
VSPAEDPVGGAPDPAGLAQRVERAWQRVVDAGGDPAAITLVAVTKGFGPEVALAAARAGLDDLGENYAQELVAKAPELEAAGLAPRWHAIGRLQRNKVRALAPVVHLWQSVDSERLGAEIARRAPGARVLVQVNVSDEPQKGGCSPEGTGDLVARLADVGLQVDGLMTVGRTGGADAARAGFATLRGLADRLDLPVRSMGMSADLEAAVAEGTTMIRLGAALFGPRPPRPEP